MTLAAISTPTHPNRPPPYKQLLGDVGGTNARLAWCWSDVGTPQDVQTLPSADHASLEDAIRHYLDHLGQPVMEEAAIAIANPIAGDWVQMTNHDWAFSIAHMQANLGLRRLLVVNDFTALALALPTLGGGERWLLGGEGSDGQVPRFDAPVALLGPGTGLGVSGLVPDARGQLIPLAGEGGHVTLPAQTMREFQVVQALQQRHGHASAERALSGAGLSHMHAALVSLAHGVDATEPPLSPAEVTARGLPGPKQDTLCAEALELFARFLGSVAGNLALTLGARAGVWVGGGIPPRLGQTWWQSSGFRAAFEAKGRFHNYLAEVPVWFIDAQDPPALRGAARALR